MLSVPQYNGREDENTFLVNVNGSKCRVGTLTASLITVNVALTLLISEFFSIRFSSRFLNVQKKLNLTWEMLKSIGFGTIPRK